MSLFGSDFLVQILDCFSEILLSSALAFPHLFVLFVCLVWKSNVKYISAVNFLYFLSFFTGEREVRCLYYASLIFMHYNISS